LEGTPLLEQENLGVMAVTAFTCVTIIMMIVKLVFEEQGARQTSQADLGSLIYQG